MIPGDNEMTVGGSGGGRSGSGDGEGQCWRGCCNYSRGDCGGEEFSV